MRRIVVQAAKEWSEFRRDRLSLALAFLLPLATLLLFGSGVRLQAKHIPIVVRDLDKSSISKRLVDHLESSEVVAKARWEATDSSTAALCASDARAIITVPNGFGDDIEFGDPTKFSAQIDGSDITTAHVMKAVARQIGISASDAAKEGKDYEVEPDVQVRFNPDLKESLFIVPGVFGIVLFMYPALLAAVAAARESELGTVVNLYTSSLSAIEALMGKAAVYILVGLLEAALTLLSGRAIFGLTFASEPSLFVVATVIYLCAAVFFGLMVGTFARSQTVAVQATATGGFFPSLLLSGFVYPIANIPPQLSWLCLFVPARYYIDACRDAFLHGTGWTCAWIDPLVLAVFAAVFFAGAWWLMRPMQLDDAHA